MTENTGRNRDRNPDRAPEESDLVRGFEENVGLWTELFAKERRGDDGDTEELVWTSLETLLRMSEADGCSIALADWNRELLVTRTEGRLRRKTYSLDTILSAGCLGHHAVRAGSPEVAAVHRDPMHLQPASALGNGFESVACFPLAAGGRIFGVQTYYFRSGRSLSGADRSLGMALAQSTALAIDNSLLQAESKRNYLTTVQALVRSLEVRDSTTSYHSLRVTQYSQVIGEQLHLSPDEMQALQYGAMLHDIGKIGIISEILQKKGRLTSEEYEVVQEHPLIGARIVETIDFLQDAVPVIRHHHEAYDGSGYPDGLEGTEIPLIARVVTVPDFFDALTSERPYRRPLPPEVAMEEIRKGIGKMFDPDIARVFLDIHQAQPVPAIS